MTNNTARTIWPHLASSEQQPKRAQPNSLADALYPKLSERQKRWDAFRERDRQSLLKHLREANEKADARLRRERGR